MITEAQFDIPPAALMGLAVSLDIFGSKISDSTKRGSGLLALSVLALFFGNQIHASLGSRHDITSTLPSIRQGQGGVGSRYSEVPLRLTPGAIPDDKAPGSIGCDPQGQASHFRIRYDQPPRDRGAHCLEIPISKPVAHGLSPLGTHLALKITRLVAIVHE
jgi:hypothetical protein